MNPFGKKETTLQIFEENKSISRCCNWELKRKYKADNEIKFNYIIKFLSLVSYFKANRLVTNQKLVFPKQSILRIQITGTFFQGGSQTQLAEYDTNIKKYLLQISLSVSDGLQLLPIYDLCVFPNLFNFLGL